MSRENRPIRTERPILLLLTALFVGAAWFLNYRYTLNMALEERGTFGDMFGAVNSLFSGLAFAGVVYAIIMQRDEIKLAKDDLDYTKQILDEQQEQLKAQNIETQKQSFEGTFFQLLRLFAETTAQLDLPPVSARAYAITGKDVFPSLCLELLNDYRNKTARVKDKTLEDFHACYDNFYRKRGSDLGHYYRLLYNLLEFIHNSGIANKKFYTGLVRAQLSDEETTLLLCTCISTKAPERLKFLVEEYGMLKNTSEHYPFSEDFRAHFDPSAFGGEW